MGDIGQKGIAGNYQEPIFDLTLHKKIWKYIAELFIPEHEALLQLKVNHLLTQKEEYDIVSSYRNNLACQFALEYLAFLDPNSVDYNIFWSNKYYDPDTRHPFCVKACPFIIQENSSCMNGLYNKYFDNYDYCDDSIVIFDKKEWTDTCLQIANLPVKQGIKIK